jgi:hypothetical protein
MERQGIVELRLELDPPAADAASTPTGWLREPSGSSRRFEGYVQLIGALDELYHRASAAHEDGGC